MHSIGSTGMQWGHRLFLSTFCHECESDVDVKRQVAQQTELMYSYVQSITNNSLKIPFASFP